MNKNPMVNHDAIRTVSAELPALASRILAGTVALLLIGATFGGRAWAITGGQPDGTAHPNVGTVIAYHPLYGVIPYFSGTLIHERVFLTAGHGVAELLNGDVVLLGVSFDPVVDLQDPDTWLPVSQAFCRYGAYNTGAADQNRTDIALLILREPVKSIAPATLPTAGLLDGLKRAGQLDAGPGNNLHCRWIRTGTGLAPTATHLSHLGRRPHAM